MRSKKNSRRQIPPGTNDLGIKQSRRHRQLFSLTPPKRVLCRACKYSSVQRRACSRTGMCRGCFYTPTTKGVPDASYQVHDIAPGEKLLPAVHDHDSSSQAIYMYHFYAASKYTPRLRARITHCDCNCADSYLACGHNPTALRPNKYTHLNGAR